MANTINLGLDSVSTIKIGADNVDAVYVGDVLVYSGGTPPTPPTPTLQWVTFNSGDVIPSDLNIYGIKGVASDIAYGLPSTKPFTFTPSRRDIEISIWNWNGTDDGSYICYSDLVGQDDNVEYILSDVGCNEFVNFEQPQTLTRTIQFLIYQ